MALLPSGLQDTISPFALQDRFITNILLDRFGLFGYAQVNPPLLEFENTLFAGKGAAQHHNSFRVMDNMSHNMMALRADITPQIERIALNMLNANMSAPTQPLRLCYAGQVLRVEPANMGGKRQLRQAGLELIGSKTQANPLEVLIAAIEALQILGLAQIVVSISCGGILQDLLGENVDGNVNENIDDTIDDVAIIKAIFHKDVEALPANTPNRAAIIALLEHDLGRATEILPHDVVEKLLQVQELVAQVQNYFSLVENGAQGDGAQKVIENDTQSQGNYQVEVYSDMLDVSSFPYHQGACFTLLDKASRTEIGRGGCYHLSDEYYGCGATLYVDNLVATKLNYPAISTVKMLSEGDFLRDGKALRTQGVVTVME